MTPAERALLLAVAKDMVRGHSPYTRRAQDLNDAIVSVEAEAEKSCEMCHNTGYVWVMLGKIPVSKYCPTCIEKKEL